MNQCKSVHTTTANIIIIVVVLFWSSKKTIQQNSATRRFYGPRPVTLEKKFSDKTNHSPAGNNTLGSNTPLNALRWNTQKRSGEAALCHVPSPSKSQLTLVCFVCLFDS